MREIRKHFELMKIGIELSLRRLLYFRASTLFSILGNALFLLVNILFLEHHSHKHRGFQRMDYRTNVLIHSLLGVFSCFHHDVFPSCREIMEIDIHGKTGYIPYKTCRALRADEYTQYTYGKHLKRRSFCYMDIHPY